MLVYVKNTDAIKQTQCMQGLILLGRLGILQNFIVHIPNMIHCNLIKSTNLNVYVGVLLLSHLGSVEQGRQNIQRRPLAMQIHTYMIMRGMLT